MSSPSYRDVLRAQYAERRARNPQYSLRAFARDIELSPSRLSEVLSKKHRLSRASAQRIARHLGLSAAEAARFCDLADREHPRSKAIRELAKRRLRAQPDARPGATAGDRWRLLDDEVKLVGSLQQLAALEVLDLAPQGLRAADLAKRLRVSLVEADLALERLARLGLVKVERGLARKTARDFATTHDVPSAAIRALHEQALDKARVALHEQRVGERSFNTLVLAVAKEQVPVALKRLHDFCRSLNDELAAAPAKDAVYCLAMQFFQLTKEGGP